MILNVAVGDNDGKEGETEGLETGAALGELLGDADGLDDGIAVGDTDGLLDGIALAGESPAGSLLATPAGTSNANPSVIDSRTLTIWKT